MSPHPAKQFQDGSANISQSFIQGGVTYTTAFTEVTDDLYYSGGYLATLKIPSLNANVKVYERTSSSVLAKGAGHFEGTSIWSGNVAVEGHNRDANYYFGVRREVAYTSIQEVCLWVASNLGRIGSGFRTSPSSWKPEA